jgi:uronate dehydrogenase
MRKVMITGAAGLVGSVLREHLRRRYRLVLLDRAHLDATDSGETVVRCDICDGDTVATSMQGVDAVVHLAGEPTEAPWEAIREANIEGCFQVVDAAHRVGVRRFVFASSNHAVGFYPRSEQVDERAMPRPDTRYGVSKVFGEALLRMYVDKHGLTAVCLRIGTLRQPDAPSESRHLSTWISHRDLAQLVICAIEADVDYEVVYGVSNNTHRWWTDRGAERLGFRPMDDAQTYVSVVPPEPPDADPLAATLHGGSYCTWDRVGSVRPATRATSVNFTPPKGTRQ